MAEETAIRTRVRRLVVSTLNLDALAADLADDEPLFGGRLGLDSVDALELVVALEKEFGIAIRGAEMERDAFASIAALAAWVEARRAAAGAASAGA
jgi:acyl carrier protein